LFLGVAWVEVGDVERAPPVLVAVVSAVVGLWGERGEAGVAQVDLGAVEEDVAAEEPGEDIVAEIGEEIGAEEIGAEAAVGADSPFWVDEAAACGVVGCPEGTALRGAGEEGCYCAAPEAACAPGEAAPLGSEWLGYGGDLAMSRRAEAPDAAGCGGWGRCGRRQGSL
jgi:hypothetical protein